ncbi:MAG: hypothetical protein JNL25_17945 [Rhodospirillaceae bacterium]|nr:hypothetical protein [Rhodospirillaceae bacterium]
MRLPRLRLGFVLCLLIGLIAPGLATAADIDTIAGEAAAYRGELLAGAVGDNPQRIPLLNTQAAIEFGANRFAEAIALRERAIGLGDESHDSWMALADAFEADRKYRQAALAAYRAFVETTEYQQQGDALNRVARNYDRLRDFERALAAFEAAQRYSYDEQAYQRADQIRGMLAFALAATRLNIEGETPEACLEFRGDLLGTDSLDYGDYVRIEPASKPSFRVSGTQLCLGDLSFGTSYRVTVLNGLPSLGGEKLAKNEEWAFSVGDRAPSVGFRTQAYVLPRIGSTGVPVITVNVDKVNLRLLRINDRNLINELYDGRFLNNLEEYDRAHIAEQSGEEIWTGEMDVTRERNRRVATAFPIDEVISETEPGIYILMARNSADAENADEYSWRWEPQATQWLVISDLGLTTFAGAGGLDVQVRSLESGRPLHRLEVRLLARNNEILASALTDTAGMAHFDPGLLRGSGGRSATAIMAFRRDGDFSFLDISGAAFDLSDRGVGGRPMPGATDLFFYTDRGVYRPGETAHVMALSRDPAAEALRDQKLTFRLLRPDGVEAERFVDIGDTGGGYHLAVDLAAAARTGNWSLEAYLDPEGDPIATTRFLVEDVIPARIEATLTPADEALDPPAPLPVQIDARYLYGAPAADLAVKAEVVIAADSKPFPEHAGYRFGLDGEKMDPVRLTYDDMVTDAEGKLEINMSFDEVPEAPMPLAATLRVEVYEFGGRPVIETLSRPIRDRDLYLGIKPLFEDDRVQQGGNAGFEVLALGRDGQSQARPGLGYRLVKEEWDYVWYYRNNRWDYDYIVRDGATSNGTLDIPAGQPGQVNLPVEWGRYRLEVFDPATATASSVRFYAGWSAQPGSGGTPDRMQVVSDRETYGVGDMAEVHLTAPFAGEAQVTIATDRVIESYVVSVPAEGKTIRVRIDKDWGAGAYVLVNAFRPGRAEARGPGRAIGLTWLGIDAAPRSLAVAMEVPENIEPRQPIEIPVTVTNLAGKDAYLTLAAVDEGILQLTDFAAPDPLAHYFGKRRLGLEVRDLYGQLIDGKEGTRGRIRSGGDGEGLAKRGAPKELKLVALFSGIVKLNEAGRAVIPLEIPDYNGRLRLMAVAWDQENVGAAEAGLVVRDVVVALATAPRFMAPGDVGTVSFAVQNVAGPTGTYAINLTASPHLRLIGEKTWSRELGGNASGDWRVNLAAHGLGAGFVEMQLTGPDGYSLIRRIDIPIRAAQPAIAQTLSQRLLPGEPLRISAAALQEFLPETADLRLSFSSTPNLDVQSVLASLSHYPYGCVEQTTSRAFPLLFAGEMAERWGLEDRYAKTDPARVQAAIGRILEGQRYDGLFGLWSSYSAPESWLTAYVMDFLIRAREQGYDVSDVAYRNGLEALNYVATSYNDESAGNLAARAYAFYVLARTKGGKLSDLRYLADNYLDRMPSGLALAQLGTALALHGDVARATLAFEAAVIAANRARRPLLDYGSDLRDWAAIIALMAEAKLPGLDAGAHLDRLAGLQLSRRYLSTQEQAWLLLAARATSSSSPPEVSIARDAEAAVSQARPYVLTLAGGEIGEGAIFVNRGDDPVYAKATASGVPLVALPPEESGFSIQRTYYHLNGDPADLSKVVQNDVLVVKIEGEVTVAQERRALVVDLLPAGFELENQRLNDTRQTNELAWLGALTPPTYSEFLDDRFIAALNVNQGYDSRRFTLAYMVRAVTPGSFALPAVAVEDMYAPDVRARGDQGRVTIEAYR